MGKGSSELHPLFVHWLVSVTMLVETGASVPVCWLRCGYWPLIQAWWSGWVRLRQDCLQIGDRTPSSDCVSGLSLWVIAMVALSPQGVNSEPQGVGWGCCLWLWGVTACCCILLLLAPAFSGHPDN